MAQADTRAVCSVIRTKLSLLHVYIVDPAQFNITVFNDYVKELLIDLEDGRGEECSDTLEHLFTAYEKCTDSSFRTYMENKHDLYLHAEKDYTPQELMDVAETHYKNRLEKGKWNQLTPEQEEVIALRAEVAESKTKATSDDKPPPLAKAGKRKALKKDSNGVPIFKGTQAWRNVPPKSGESEIKTVNGVVWKYCKEHKYWCKHTTSECEITKKKKMNDLCQKKEQGEDIRAALAELGLDDINDEDEESIE